MKFTNASTIFLSLAVASQQATAFAPTTKFSSIQRPTTTTTHAPRFSSSQLYSRLTPEQQTEEDDEIERLKSMAQKLRAEAAALEAERAEEISKAAEDAFRKFDKNDDGEITFEELKAGLEKSLKMELPEKRVMKLMQDFDTSGDGKLQPEEFVGVEKFRNRLEQLIREEKQQAREAKLAAEKEAEAARLIEARMNILNDGEPTTKDKIISVLPYLFPLLDSLQFGRFLVAENPENPFVVVLALLFTLYKSIPFSGFLSFLALNILSGNPGINRLVRFNMQQAIFLDIALFFPGLIGAVFALAATGAGVQFPSAFTEISSDLIFGTLLLTIGYACVSSLLGVTPNKIPGISQAVEDRMPTVDMFDDEGRFIPRQMREKKDDEDDKKKDD
mmetsp:Transcript_131589/g.380636  ORF Transcript_131589/g.380636 Transcript_131589/m.380636 type:complete len:389 (-) Transcript_131589:122-1288(-)